jgi:hypothetical protein
VGCDDEPSDHECHDWEYATNVEQHGYNFDSYADDTHYIHLWEVQDE